MTIKPQLILFDVYETLLDMSSLEKKINHLLDSKRGYELWLELLMQYTFADNCIDQFHDFNSIAAATLKMTAFRLKEKVSDSEIESSLDILRYLPVHEEVQPTLSAIRDLDIRIAALTNIPKSVVKERMETTGLVSYFEIVMSADEIQKYKPSKNVYKWASEKVNLPPEEILMVTSHGWDVAGAENAGMQTAYKRQTRQLLYSLSNAPTLEIDHLSQLIDILQRLPA